MAERINFDSLTKSQRDVIMEDLVKHPFVVLAANEANINTQSAADEVFQMVRMGFMQLGLDKDGRLLRGKNEQIAVSAYDLDLIAPGVAAAIVQGKPA